MPPKPSRSPLSGHLVTAVLVSHDGARWLGECIDGLAEQTVPPHRLVAVDTGSVDGSDRILAEALGESAVVRLPRDARLATAVQAGLDAFNGAPAPPSTRGAPITDWVWLLHDDSAPEPEALAELLAAVEASPSAAVLGPKLRSWDGRHLLQVGLTIDSSGRPQTGMEPGEVDQGQHDGVGDVLAVSTAGMLIRRDVWDELGGLDEAWSLFGVDVDFGWRVNATGRLVRAVPRAVVRHAEALTAGGRDSAAEPLPTAVADRAHGMQVVLANTAGWLVPLLVMRYVVECLLRSLLLLLSARPRAATAEGMALVVVLSRPHVITAARRRRHGRTVPHRDLRPLLAAPTLRWRRLGEVAAALLPARSGAGAPTAPRRAAVETGPVAPEAEALPAGPGQDLARVFLRPLPLLFLALTAAGLVASRGVLGTLHGGRLAPATGGAGDLWSLYRDGWHAVGLGSTTVAPPATALLALLASVLAGKVWLAVAVLLVGAAPLAGLSAYAATARITRSPWLRVWAAVVWATAPVLTGAVTGGRIDAVAAVILLPLVIRAVVGAVVADAGHWPRWVAAGLVLAVGAGFAPVLWPLAVAGVLGAALLAPRHVERLGALAAVVVLPALLLEPWTLTLLSHPRLLVSGYGLPEFVSSARPLTGYELLGFHPGGPAQPVTWALLPLLVALLAATTRAGRERAAGAAVGIAAVGFAAALVVSRVSAPAAAGRHYWDGVCLAVATAGAILGGLVAADRAGAALRRHGFGWRQPVAVLIAAGCAVAAVVPAVHWLGRGAARPLSAAPTSVLPLFAAAELTRPTSPRVLVLQSQRGAVRWSVLRRPDEPQLGEADDAAAEGPVDARLSAAVRAALAGQPDAGPRLAQFGISLLVVPRSASAGLARLDQAGRLSQLTAASALVWRVTTPTGRLVELTGSGRQPLPGARPRVAPGPPGRLLVLAEPADSHWQASVDGHALTATKAYGWAQAWRLPATGGALSVRRTGGHRGWLLLLELALWIAAAVAARPRSGSPA
jgi:GT2 family glycosyltransferase